MSDGRAVPAVRLGCAAGTARIYSVPMPSTAPFVAADPPKRVGFARIFAWPRLRFVLAVSVGLGIISGLHNDTLPRELFRAAFMGCCILFVFGLFVSSASRYCLIGRALSRVDFSASWLAAFCAEAFGVDFAVAMSFI